ncbi:hypothetical protein PV08_04145 [Exophiala spinifera]|uniref:Zn(2)-C6 fungal-type domain-containing protein n=1 Tax=Exophiala spinifera TaxID=91928 RepID=A0A0D2C038_9EURO|nr:uncharacterized protein PV08_04145 [Exophiala spinifera]KIW16954.1 hypothetical protein PV08_04145 [Exophiala spinifera]
MPASHSRPDSQETTSPPPSYKRRRIALACTSCRNRKSRCNGAKPSCSLCIELGFECVYQQPAAGNGKPIQAPTGYDERLRAIEDTLRQLVQQKDQSPGQSDQFSHDAEIANRQFRGSVEALPPPLDGEDVAILDDDGPAQQHGGGDSVDGMAAITDPEEKEPRFYGPSSNISLLREISDATSASLKAMGQSRHPEHSLNTDIVSRAVSPMTSLPPEMSPVARQGINVRSLPPENKVLLLIRLFFADTGMLFPYIHEESVLRTYANARRNRLTAVSRSWLCLLNVIFAFATYITAKPDQTAEKNAAESDVFIERAQALASGIELKSARLETVQCLLLMAQYQQGTQRSDQAWNLHGLAVRAALQLGLHSRAASAGCSLLEAELRKRVWLACMVLDRTLSMTFGRPSTIPNEYVKLELPINQNLERLATSSLGGMPALNESLEPPATVCFYIATIQLYYILGDVITQLYGSNVDVDPDISMLTLIERTLALEQRLSAWKRNLFPQLQRRPWDTFDSETISTSTWDPVFDRLSVVITLRYLNTRVLLHRPVLSAFLRKRACYKAATVQTDGEDPYFLGLAEKSLEICEKSATEIVQIVFKTSEPPTLLGAWWFSAYYTFNAALVIFGCILLKLTTVNKWSHGGATITISESFDCDRVVGMIAYLRRAAEALQRFGEGTRSSKRIQRTLVKLVQICMALARFSPEHGSTILSAFSSYQYPSDTAQTQAQQQAIVTVSSIGAPAPVLLNGAMPNTIQTDDPFTMFDMHMPQYWTDANLDIFSDLVGVDTGIAAMLSG